MPGQRKTNQSIRASLPESVDGISARHHTSDSLEKKGPGREKPSHDNGKRRRAIAIACKAHKRSPELFDGEMNWGSTKHR